VISENIMMKAVPWGRRIRDRQFERIWNEHRPRIWRLTARLAGSADHADDLTQEVAMRACEAYAGFQGQSNVYSWLYRIAVNVVLRSRERKAHPTVTLTDPSASSLPAQADGPDVQAIRRDLRSRIWEAINGLPDDQRAALILQVYEGLAYREIALALDVPIGTVKSRLNAATKRLRKELGSDDM